MIEWACPSVKILLTTPQPFYGHFFGTTRVSQCLDYMLQGKINRGRHTDQPAGRHSIRTNQCLPPPSSTLTLLVGQQEGYPACKNGAMVKILLNHPKRFPLGYATKHRVIVIVIDNKSLQNQLTSSLTNMRTDKI